MKSRYAVALVGLVASKLAWAGAVPVGVTLGVVAGTPVGPAIAEATGMPIEAIGNGAVLAIAAVALVVGIRIIRRKRAR